MVVTNTNPPISLSIEVTPGNRHDGIMLPHLFLLRKDITPIVAEN